MFERHSVCFGCSKLGHKLTDCLSAPNKGRSGHQDMVPMEVKGHKELNKEILNIIINFMLFKGGKGWTRCSMLSLVY